MKTFRLWACLLFGLLLCGSVFGCQQLKLLRSQSPEKQDEDADNEELQANRESNDGASKDKEFETKVLTPLVGDYTTVAGLNLVTLHGVGLVVGLDGTGGDPPPSQYREALVNDMRKRNIHDPESILRSPNTALVVVRAYLPPLVRKGESFDVDVYAIDEETKTLNGGWLLETDLSEAAVVQGQGVMKGHVLAKAKGPIMVTSGEAKADSTGTKLRGRILGGGFSKKDRDLRLQLRSEFKSVRQSRRIASKVGERFFAYNNSGLREPLAKPLTDQTIELKVLPRYKDNYPRYLQVIRHIAFRETAVARHVRMEKLKTQLLDPETAEQAALQLEAIGNDAVPVLKSGLKHGDLEVRFHAAMALAYLGQSDGVKVLGEAAINERAFRVYALAALATLDDAEAHLLLRDLMSAQKDSSDKVVDSAELRYGAFRALWTLDKRDPFLNGELLKEPNTDRELFALHTLTVSGDPIVHLTQHRRSEIVLFGNEQKFQTPMVARAGNQILVTSPPGKDYVVVSRYQAGQPDRRKEVSPRVDDVIRTVVEFGGTYPDVAQLLLQAAKQQNLVGRVEIDSLPQAGREYVRRSTSGNSEVAGASKKVRVGNPNLVPNFVPNLKDTASNSKQTFGEAIEAADSKPNKSSSNDGHSEPPVVDSEVTVDEVPGNASLADTRQPPPQEPEPRWYEFWKRK